MHLIKDLTGFSGLGNTSVAVAKRRRRILRNTETTYKMKKNILIVLSVLLLFTACRTKEKVLYFQDVENDTPMPTQPISPLTYMPGDKLSVVVSSGSTPQIAQQFNLPVITLQAGTGQRSTTNQIAYYTVDERGCIDIPTLGKIKVGGLTRSETAEKIQSQLRDNAHLLDAVVTINSYDQYVTILGEVKTPGRISIGRDNITLLEAIGQAGDLTIQARRDRISVTRQEGDESRTYYVDIRSKDLLNSPVYNLKQNDVIYVEPNSVRMGQSTNNDNSIRSISTWLSATSVLISLYILIFKK